MTVNKKIQAGWKVIKGLDTGKCYVVGGYVRNLVMSRDSYDVDIVVEKISSARDFADKLDGSYFVLGNVLHRVITNSIKWDFTELNEDIGNNLAKRDFSIDSMAIDIKKISNKDILGKIIDPFKGLNDINLKLLRPVSTTVFADDHVRILRAYRLKAELQFEFTDDLEKLIHDSLNSLKNEKGERIREELEKIFSCNKLNDIIKAMVANKVFENIYPGVCDYEKINETLIRLAEIYVPESIWNELLLIAIWQNYGIGGRLKVSNERKKYLKELLNNDMDIFEVWYAFVEDTEAIFKGKYVLTGNREFLGILERNQDNLKYAKHKPLIAGDEVMGITGLPPSKKVGCILKGLLKEQFKGKIRNRREAIEYIKNKK